MKIIKVENYLEMSAYIADRFIEQINEKKNSVLGLATGSTPEGAYKILCDKFQNGEIDFSLVTTFNLDEYYPINPADKNSYRYFMEEKLFSKVNIKRENINIPLGNAVDAAKECELYEKKIQKAGGIDLQLLGIGVNGHIGFNEPAESLDGTTHMTQLTQQTIKSNARFFENEQDVPKYALTMGIGSIMKARSIIIAAGGNEKKKAISMLCDGKINTMCPATILCAHPDVTLVYYD